MAVSLGAWLPVWADLSHVPTAAEDEAFASQTSWRGIEFRWHRPGRTEGGDFFFSGSYWGRQTALHWEIPLVAVAIYLISIPLLQHLVARRGRFDVRCCRFWWNASLSVFSFGGVVALLPVLLGSLVEHGLYFTACAPAQWYGTGWSGFFMALFIYSKLAELMDTVWLALSGTPVMALQWWHHSTVLLYCWHAYSVRLATGAWFAGMNYTVHWIMYGYFALAGTRHRKMAAPFAIYITLLQLLQMLMGMFLVVKAMRHQMAGEECHVNRSNSVLCLAMYASYFLLFLKLFVENYFLRPKSLRKSKSAREVLRSVSRKITMVPQSDEDEPAGGAAKKLD